MRAVTRMVGVGSEMSCREGVREKTKVVGHVERMND